MGERIYEFNQFKFPCEEKSHTRKRRLPPVNSWKNILEHLWFCLFWAFHVIYSYITDGVLLFWAWSLVENRHRLPVSHVSCGLFQLNCCRWKARYLFSPPLAHDASSRICVSWGGGVGSWRNITWSQTYTEFELYLIQTRRLQESVSSQFLVPCMMTAGVLSVRQST